MASSSRSPSRAQGTLAGLLFLLVSGGLGWAVACSSYVPPDVANYGPPNGLSTTKVPATPPGEDAGASTSTPPSSGDGGTSSSGDGSAPAVTYACETAGGTLLTPGTCSVSWKTTIYPKMQASGAWGCAGTSCHGVAGGPQPLLTGSTEQSFYTTLANYTGVNSLPYFNPCSTNPAQSTFVCNTSTATCMVQMPLGGTIADPTDIATWVACGAPEN